MHCFLFINPIIIFIESNQTNYLLYFQGEVALYGNFIELFVNLEFFTIKELIYIAKMANSWLMYCLLTIFDFLLAYL